MRYYKLLKIFIRVAFIIIAIYLFRSYIIFNDVLSHKSPIEYKYVDKKEHIGRGSHYDMTIIYEGKTTTVDITSKNYHDIDKNKFPALFLSKEKNVVFSKWEVKVKFRLALLFLAGFFLTFIPLKVWNNSVGKVTHR